MSDMRKKKITEIADYLNLFI